MSGEYCGMQDCTCPDPTWPEPHVNSGDELAQLPNLSVVQFRGPGLGERNRLVWQLDEEWFSAGSEWSLPSNGFPPDAFPAAVLWVPELSCPEFT
jgi:hypothetical protein